MRVITNQQDVSNDREQLESKADYNMLSSNAVQQSAKLARGGDLKKA